MKTVAIIGKPNVGKSTLFNRLINKQKSIVHDESGVTRDRIYDTCEWLTRKFDLIDTGGLSNINHTFQENINEQVIFAIEEANVIVFVVSKETGLDNQDYYVNKILKKYRNDKKIILVLNKCENMHNTDISSFYQLGYGEPIIISSAHGIGIGDLLDEIIKNIDQDEKVNNDDIYSFCIIGKPNVGKSSLVNGFLNKNQVIVSPIAGSTRDSTDSYFKYNNEEFRITDTAGIKRKGKISENLDKFAYLRAQKAINNSKQILLMLDGSLEFSEQDEVIAGLCYKANIPTIIVVNKIDLIDKYDEHKVNELTKIIREKFKFIAWAPIIFISAKEKIKIIKILDVIIKIRDKVNKKINTALLNEIILKAQMIQKPSLYKGNRISISYATQVQSQIPTFVIFCNNPKYLHFSYARYIENQIRKSFDLLDVPVCLYWKDKNSRNRGSNE